MFQEVKQDNNITNICNYTVFPIVLPMMLQMHKAKHREYEFKKNIKERKINLLVFSYLAALCCLSPSCVSLLHAPSVYFMSHM